MVEPARNVYRVAGRFYVNRGKADFMRTSGIFLLLALAAVPTARAGNDGLTGNWKVTIFDKDKQLNFWILKLEAKDGKWTGTAVALHDVAPSTVSDIDIKG